MFVSPPAHDVLYRITSSHLQPVSVHVQCVWAGLSEVPLWLCFNLLTQQKAKETSETEAAKQPTKTSDSRLRRGHGHVAPLQPPEETLHLSQKPTSSRHYSEGHGCLHREWTRHRAEKLQQILLAETLVRFNHFKYGSIQPPSPPFWLFWNVFSLPEPSWPPPCSTKCLFLFFSFCPRHVRRAFRRSQEPLERPGAGVSPAASWTWQRKLQLFPHAFTACP